MKLIQIIKNAFSLRMVCSIFNNDAHEIVSKRGKEILAKNQKDKYTFIPNGKTSRTQSDMVDIIIGVNGKRRKYK
jgi:hypothetical protein